MADLLVKKLTAEDYNAEKCEYSDPVVVWAWVQTCGRWGRAWACGWETRGNWMYSFVSGLRQEQARNARMLKCR
ncbi:hypothetical protein E2C01_025297 [Portunus trituberculatus]|uniref:Uncharacterized protein n=1 Tax=Portunus trituberculatus TaxID=210409 RepID=A0A5B7EF34_PORTR|nr:hypothetical protein [Portunus trituberculatus]